MTVKVEKLLKMAEQIRDNMAYVDDKDVVANRIADHLSRFWDPRMLEVIETYQQEHPEALSAELSTAVQLLRSPNVPPNKSP